MAKKTKKTIRFTVKIKDCPIEFKDGMGKGVVAFEDVVFTENPPLKFDSAMFSVAIHEQSKKLMDKYFEIEVEEV